MIFDLEKSAIDCGTDLYEKRGVWRLQPQISFE
jgi:hypothetical protein